jgi:hypothetical protein
MSAIADKANSESDALMMKLVAANKHASVFTCLLAVLALPACKKSEPTGSGDPAAAAAPTPPNPAAESPADQAEGAKLSAAIECLNRHSGNIFEVRDAYLASVDPATGSSRGKKPTLPGLYGTEPCQRGVKEAAAVTPAIPALDSASATYVAALDTVVKAYEELTGYYQKGDYLDDKGKKAETLHPKVVEAFKGFAAANKELSSQVRMMNRKRTEAKLAAREKAEGRNLEVIIDSMMLEAETLVAMASKPDADLAALDAQIAAYGKSVDEVDTYASAHPDEASKRGSMANLRNYDKTFLAASKVVSRKLRDKKTPTADELEDVTKQYNSLVDNYNNH